jgi:hypothetical protein
MSTATAALIRAPRAGLLMRASPGRLAFFGSAITTTATWGLQYLSAFIADL